MKTLLCILDEAQPLAQLENFSIKMLRLRHALISVIAGFQNISKVSVEFSGNADVHISFQCIDKRDRQAFGNHANLQPAQAEQLAFLKPSECACLLSRSNWKRALIGTVPHVDFQPTDDQDLLEKSKTYCEQFSWQPLEEPAPPEEASKLGDIDAERFLLDVLNQKFEECTLTQRFTRTGIRSSAKKSQVLKKLQGDGWIKVWQLPVKQGAPWKIAEPTKKAFEAFGVTWKKARGNCPTRVAMILVLNKVKKLEGWQVVREGTLRDHDDQKQVDLLCRDPENQVVTVEIAGNPDHEIANCLFCLRYKKEVIRKHVVIAVDKQILEQVKKKFTEFPEIANDDRVEAITLSEALSTWIP